MGTSTVLMVIVMHRFISFLNGMDGSFIFYRLMYAMGWSWWCLLFCCCVISYPAACRVEFHSWILSVGDARVEFFYFMRGNA